MGCSVSSVKLPENKQHISFFKEKNRFCNQISSSPASSKHRVKQIFKENEISVELSLTPKKISHLYPKEIDILEKNPTRNNPNSSEILTSPMIKSKNTTNKKDESILSLSGQISNQGPSLMTKIPNSYSALMKLPKRKHKKEKQLLDVSFLPNKLQPIDKLPSCFLNKKHDLIEGGVKTEIRPVFKIEKSFLPGKKDKAENGQQPESTPVLGKQENITFWLPHKEESSFLSAEDDSSFLKAELKNSQADISFGDEGFRPFISSSLKVNKTKSDSADCKRKKSALEFGRPSKTAHSNNQNSSLNTIKIREEMNSFSKSLPRDSLKIHYIKKIEDKFVERKPLVLQRNNSQSRKISRSVTMNYRLGVNIFDLIRRPNQLNACLR